MNFETRKFTYVKEDGSLSNREVFVIAEDTNYVMGLDLAHIPESEKSSVKALTGTIQNASGRNVSVPNGFKEGWKSAWRCFKKTHIR